MTNEDKQIHVLHRYFIWTNRLRANFKSEIQSKGSPPSEKTQLRHWLIGPFSYFSMWMAMLYVVCEGWKELGMKDPMVDSLLLEDRLRILGRYRNGVFHFQKKYFDRRFTEFFERGDEITGWADDLHSSFSDYFLRWYRKRGLKYSLKQDENGDLMLDILIEQKCTERLLKDKSLKVTPHE